MFLPCTIAHGIFFCRFPLGLQSHASYDVGHGGMDRAQLSALFTCNTPRSKPTSLFRAKPYSANGVAMESVSASPPPAAALPRPDWSEFTFFAPFVQANAAQQQPHATNGVSLVGSRTYVCLRHTHAALQPTGAAFAMPKFRYCTAVLTQASDTQLP